MIKCLSGADCFTMRLIYITEPVVEIFSFFLCELDDGTGVLVL